MAARARLTPTYGNLLHHAVEMYLKGALAGSVSSIQMKKKYGHNLKRLWNQFKAQYADLSLVRFDAPIRALHKFEDIRYPDKFAAQGGIVSIAWKPSHAVINSGSRRQPPKYEVFISEVDRLVIEILKRSSINPKFFVGRLGRSGRGALAYQNPHATRWRRRRR